MLLSNKKGSFQYLLDLMTTIFVKQGYLGFPVRVCQSCYGFPPPNHFSVFFLEDANRHSALSPLGGTFVKKREILCCTFGFLLGSSSFGFITPAYKMTKSSYHICIT